jgi:hypothetical protein
VPFDYPTYHEPMATRKSLKISKTSKKKKSDKEKEGKDKPYLPCSIYKAGWRELESILRLPSSTGVNHSGAWVFKHLANQMDSHPKITIMVAGFASFQAKKEALLEWVFTLPAGFLAERNMLKYKKFVETAEECSKTLNTALWVCINSERKNSKPGNKDNVLAAMKASASSEYWPQMEIFAMKVLETITEDKDWEPEILKEARLIYDRACPGISMNSRVKGLQLLYTGRN